MFHFLATWLKPKEATEFAQLNTKLTHIMSQLDQLESRLTALSATLSKATGEITNELSALREALVSIELPPAAVAALENLEAQAAALDAIIPDAPPAEDAAPEGEAPITEV